MRYAVGVLTLAVWLIPIVMLFNSPVEAGHVWADDANCRGFFGDVVCRTNYDPYLKDRMFVRTIDQLGSPANANLASSIIIAESNWSNLGAGPQFISPVPNIDDSYNFIKGKSAAEVRAKAFGISATAVSMLCTASIGGDHCQASLSVPVNAEWSELWVVTEAASPFCYCAGGSDDNDFTLRHEMGHILGLGHDDDLPPSLMTTQELGSLRPVPGPREAGSVSDCTLDGNHHDDGIRCIYNWYNCGDTDCDNIGAGDNCPSAPNQTQRDRDGEVLDLRPLYNSSDFTSIRGDNAGDICDDDDDGDGLATGQELFFIPCSTATGPTDPLNDDSDGDLVGDGIECLLGFDPVNAASKPPATPDADNDGLANGYEILVFGTNPNAADSDGDKLNDGAEGLRYRSSALSMNTDGSVEPHPCQDGQEVASLNSDYGANPGDQAVLANYINTYGGVYPRFDHTRRNFDINRDGVVNPGDQALQASIIGAVGGNCRP